MACPLAPLQQHPSGFTGTLGSSRCAAAQHFTLCPQFSSAQAAFIFAGWDNTSAFFKTQVRSHTSWKPWRYCLPIWVKFTMLCVPRSTLVRPHHCWRGQVKCPARPNSLVCKVGLKTSCDNVAGLCQLTCAKNLTRDLMLSKFSTNDCRYLLLTHWVRNLQRVVQILALRGYSIRVWKWMFKAWEGNNLVGWDGEGRGWSVQVGGTWWTYGWFMLMFGRKQCNTVKQLPFD